MILLIKVVRSLDIWWNLVNTDTGGTCHSVRIKRVNSRENIRAFFFVGTNETVRFIRVSVGQGSTVVKFSAYIVAYLRSFFVTAKQSCRCNAAVFNGTQSQSAN